ncbi:hypothetical protein G7Y89_g1482 [Cudoniella acicularis]|uniref:Glycosyl hydrolase family 13 catalytic domain-containing protein n=1 Tax=Cudoniella acicularis TaxID=354080 RepID=A0A8H4W7V4_9HELO|nr:hypothetical protein G7Y89_g1482 [Cudoniella acicularis]
MRSLIPSGGVCEEAAGEETSTRVSTRPYGYIPPAKSQLQIHHLFTNSRTPKDAVSRTPTTRENIHRELRFDQITPRTIGGVWNGYIPLATSHSSNRPKPRPNTISMADTSGFPSRGKSVCIVTTSTFVLTTVFVVSRLVSRFGILKSRTAADDWFIILAWFLAFGLSFSIDWGTAKGLGRHDANIPESWVPSLRRSEYAFTILYFLLGMRLPQRQKTILVFTFGLGIFVTIVDVIRIYYLQQASSDQITAYARLGTSVDFAWNASAALMWSAIEVNVGIICACIPTLKPLIKLILPSMITDHTRSSQEKSGSFSSQLNAQPHERLPSVAESSPRFRPLPHAQPGGNQEHEMDMMDFLTTPDTPHPNIARSQTAHAAATENTVYFGFVNMKKPKSMLKTRGMECFKYCTAVTILFFLWGFSYGLLNTLNNEISAIAHQSVGQTLGLTTAYFGAYFFGAMTVGQWVLRCYGFKATFITGLCIYGTGTLMFWPSAVLMSFPGFIISNFVVGFGLSVLETAANPFLALCGPSQSGEFRLLMAQGVQAVASVVSQLLAEKVLFNGIMENSSLIDVQWTYLAVALFTVILALFFYYMPLPEATDTDLQRQSDDLGIYREEAVFSPKLRLIYTTLGLAVFAQFCYVAAQESMSVWFETVLADLSITTPLTLNADNYVLVGLTTFAVGRFLFAFLCLFIPSRILLLIAFAGCIIFSTLTMSLRLNANGIAGPALVFFFFEGPVWPMVYAIGLRGQGKSTKFAAACITAARAEVLLRHYRLVLIRAETCIKRAVRRVLLRLSLRPATPPPSILLHKDKFLSLFPAHGLVSPPEMTQRSVLPIEMESSTPAATAHRPRITTYRSEENITSGSESCITNQTMFQGFEWYCPSNNKHWQLLAAAVPHLAALGITSMWIPPATKSACRDSNGYSPYDLYDLGEFNQKGARCTKWGAKEDLVDFVEVANSHGVGIIFDAVLNHKAGADYAEPVLAVKVDPEDRMKAIGKPELIEAWTGFDFKGRAGAYSSMRWNKDDFTGVDHDNKTKTNAVWQFENKKWAEDVDEELGNYDYLMFADIDHTSPSVREDLFNWVQWLSSQLKLGGLRLDAIKHYSANFLRDLFLYIDQSVDRDWFIVGEYWRDDSEVLAQYIEYMNNRISLFDVKLLGNFSRLSLMNENADLRTVFNGSLAALKPKNTVTFVANHDTQVGRSFEVSIAPYFIPIAYTLILLRSDAGLPCIFYADIYGSLGPTSNGNHNNSIPPTSGGLVLPKLILARKMYAYGSQMDFFDQPDCIGFTRLGHPSQSGGAGLAVLVSNGWEVKTKRMNVGRLHAGEIWTDVLRWCWGEVVIDEDGWGVFRVGPRSVSVWVSETARGRERLDELVFDHHFFNFKDVDSIKVKPEKKNPKKLRLKKSYPDWLRPEANSEVDIKDPPGELHS